MLVCRYDDGGERGYGRIDGDRVTPVRHDPRAGRWVPRAGRARALADIALLPPAAPTKIACVALNYAPAGVEVRRPPGAESTAIVLKPPSTVAGPGDRVVHPGSAWELKHEAELAVVIGVACKGVRAERAAAVIAGYTCANDITAYAVAAEPDPSGFPAVWAKHFDGTTPLGPWLATDIDPAAVDITCLVDGETRQAGSTRDLITPVHEAIAAASSHMTLLPGDVVLTGTPPGSGPLVPGDRVQVSISGIGALDTVIA